MVKVFDVKWQLSRDAAESSFQYSFSNERVFARADEARLVLNEEIDAAGYMSNFDGIKVCVSPCIHWVSL